MTNVAPFSYRDLQAVIGDAAAHLPADISIVGVSTDSRTLTDGNVFIALRGERFDGHDHVDRVLREGNASCAVVSEDYLHHAAADLRPRLIGVPDTLRALGSFAWWHRRRFGIPVIAIAGAAGKTSTKELTAAVVSQAFRVLKTEANYNNQVGTPLTLLQLAAEHQAAVIEIGTNEPGEIELLSAMVQPTHGLITNIGKEHLEKLIDLDGVEREETALFDYLNDHDGLAFVNADDERLRTYERKVGRTITFGLDHDADIRIGVTFDASLLPVVHIIKDTFTFRARLATPGIAAARNAVCAIAIGWSLQMSADEVRVGLESYDPPASHGYARMSVERMGGLTILNDTYNANPESMRVALDTLGRYPGTRRLAVLGDMRELGDASEDEHMAILGEAASHADAVIVTGDEFRRAVERLDAPHVLWCATHSGCVEQIRSLAGTEAIILVKGSRGMTMEKVIALLHE